MLARRPLVGIVIVFMAGIWFGLAVSLPLPSLICAPLLFSVAAFALPGPASPGSPFARQVLGVIGFLSLYLAILFAGCALAECRGQRDSISLHVRLPIREARAGPAGPSRFSPKAECSRRQFWKGAEAARRQSADAGGRAGGAGSIRNAAMRRLYLSRRRAAAVLGIGVEDRMTELGVMRAMVLGYRSQLDPATREVFALCGALHVFAISGLHVGIVGMLIIFVLCAFKVSRVRWAFYLVPLLGIYVFMTGARASAMRAWIMAAVYFSAPAFRRRADPVSSLAMAALLILAFDPRQLLDVGFIFSFTVVLGLLVFYPWLQAALRPLWQADPLRLQEETKWVIQARIAGRVLLSWAALSAVAWLASAPLTAHFFGQFIPGALLANIFVIPMAFLIVTSGCLSLVAGTWIELGAEIFNNAGMALINALISLMEWLSSVPLLCLSIPEPPLWFVWAWYALLGAALLFMMDRGIGE